MIERSRHNVVGVLVDAVEYGTAVARIIEAAREGRGYAVTALAVHGLMVAARDPVHRYRINRFDLVTPDGQPVRWALNLLYRCRLRDRVYGPRLTADVCKAAGRSGIPIYLYGSEARVLDRLVPRLQEMAPGLTVAGAEPSRFRRITPREKRETAARIRASGARITLVGLGCPRQEVFAYEYRDALRMPVLAVGAAFDYLAGLMTEPPDFLQRAGLQWAYRLAQEPARLWRRYLLLNPAYLALLTLQALGLHTLSPEHGVAPAVEELYG